MSFQSMGYTFPKKTSYRRFKFGRTNGVVFDQRFFLLVYSQFDPRVALCQSVNNRLFFKNDFLISA